MKITSSLAVVALAGVLLAAPRARAVTLLDLVDPPDQTNTPYSLSFAPASSTTTISIGGYQLLDFELTTNIGLFLNDAGSNLLGANWLLTPAPPLASDTYTFDDGTSVPAIAFAATIAGDYDTYSQTVATTPGQPYSLDFLYSNDVYGGGPFPSGLLVTAIASTVPEPPTWMLTLLGVAGLGFLRSKNVQPRARAVA